MYIGCRRFGNGGKVEMILTWDGPLLDFHQSTVEWEWTICIEAIFALALVTSVCFSRSVRIN